MKKDKENKIHLGVYGLVVKEDKILVIKKARGPYKGKYDLPGGRIEFGESIEDALRREIREETGLSVSDASFLSIEEFFLEYINEDGCSKEFHHVGIYYAAEVGDGVLMENFDGHDSEGALFVKMNEIEIDDIAPIAFKAMRKIM